MLHQPTAFLDVTYSSGSNLRHTIRRNVNNGLIETWLPRKNDLSALGGIDNSAIPASGTREYTRHSLD